MEPKKDSTHSYRELINWIDHGKQNKYFKDDGRINFNCQNNEAFMDWLDSGNNKGFINFPGISQHDIASLDARFKLVISLLSSLIILLPFLLWFLIWHNVCSFWIVIVSGIFGSSAAAFISTLDRYAKGYEDIHGNAYPDPDTKKERFNQRFSNWLLFRPVLGIVAACLIYFGANTLLSDSDFKPDSPESYAFIGIVAGLFAKTLIKSLLDTFKAMLGKS